MNSTFCKALLDKINVVRGNPKSFAARLKGLTQFFDGYILRLPDKPQGIYTQEGSEVYREAAQELMGTIPMKVLVNYDELNRAAEQIAHEIGRLTDMSQLAQVDMNGIIHNYGFFQGEFSVNFAFDSPDTETCLMNLIVDDGYPSRSNRRALMNNIFNSVGCAIISHEVFKYCVVIVIGKDFYAGDSHIPNKKRGH